MDEQKTKSFTNIREFNGTLVGTVRGSYSFSDNRGNPVCNGMLNVSDAEKLIKAAKAKNSGVILLDFRLHSPETLKKMDAKRAANGKKATMLENTVKAMGVALNAWTKGGIKPITPEKATDSYVE